MKVQDVMYKMQITGCWRHKLRKKHHSFHRDPADYTAALSVPDSPNS